MKISKFAGIIIAFILAILGIILFLSMASTEAKQDYFEGKILENADNYITVKIDSSYENLTSELGEIVKIEKDDVVRRCDFSKFSSNEDIRILYSGINSKKGKLEHIFAVYALSEIQ